MVLGMVIFLVFLQPILSRDSLSWSEYKKINRLITLTISEHNHRKNVYLQNLAKIKEHNDKFKKGLVSYSMTMNRFGHLTEEEFAAKYTQSHYNNRKMHSKTYEPPKNVTLPASVDWRLQNAVTPVKDQDYCKTCYIFASVAAIESHYFIKYKKLLSFSEQQIVDCGKVNGGSDGCKTGGYTSKVFEYVRDVGLTTDDRYPYESVAGPCRIQKYQILVKLKTYKLVKRCSVDDVKTAITLLGPVTASINGRHIRFISGKEILTGNWCQSNTSITHLITLIGYNTTPSGISYWIIKNTWGADWGDKGYFYLEITENDICRVSQKVFIPYVN